MISIRKKKTPRAAALIMSLLMLASSVSGCADTFSSDDEEGSVTSAPLTEQESEVTTAALGEPVSQPVIQLSKEPTKGLIASVEPTSTDGDSITCDSAFDITVTEDITEEELKAMLEFTPEVPFSVQKNGDNKFVVIPQSLLAGRQLVKLAVKNSAGDKVYRWAFQTSGDIVVRKAYPLSESYSGYVSRTSVDTGIEVTFSGNIDAETAKDYFSITPEVSGTFDSNRSTLYFIPDRNLQYSAGYTVTLKAGLPSADGGELKEDYSFTFETYSKDYNTKSFFYISDYSETYIQGDPYVMDVYVSDDITTAKMNIYKVSDDNDYIRLLKTSTYESADVSKLDNVFSETVDILEVSSSGKSFIMLPDDLTDGKYFSTVTANGTTINKPFQISPVSVYSTIIPGQAEFFVNDTNTGKSAAGAKIELITDTSVYEGTADSNGLAVIDIKDSGDKKGIVKIQHDGSVYIDSFYYSGNRGTDPRDRYFLYLYTDRAQYNSTDTIYIQGFIAPRSSGDEIPDDLRLVFDIPTYYRDYYENELDLSQYEYVDITPDKNGMFTYKREIRNMTKTWVSNCSIATSEEILYSRTIFVEDYVKPEYEVSVQSPKVVIFDTDDMNVRVSIDVAYYEGTPATDAVLSIGQKEYYTDENGHIDAVIDCSGNDTDSYLPQGCGFYGDFSGVDNNNSGFTVGLLGIFRDVMVTADYNEGKNSLSFESNFLTLDNYDPQNDTIGYDECDCLKGPASNSTINVNLHKIWYEKVETGSHYDYLLKKSITDYRYDRHDDSIGKYTVKTENGKAVLTDLPETEQDCYYYIDFSWGDSRGRKVQKTYYFGFDSYYKSYNATGFKSLRFRSSKSDNNQNNYYTRAFDLETPIRFTVVDGLEDDVFTEKGKVLFTVHGNTFVKSTVFDSTTFDYTMDVECIPTVDVCGAFFDGRHVYPISPVYNYLYRYDPSDRALNVSVTGDKDSYSPGSSAELSIDVTGLDGKPAGGTAVLISVVDEAAFAVMDQNEETLKEMYRSIYIPTARQYFSYIQHTSFEDMGAEMGGGGDDARIRKKFLDNALFKTVVTDDSGKAKLSFDFPDNLTRWRVTAVAINYDEPVGSGKTAVVRCGNIKTPLIVTQPVFIDPIMGDSFIDGDDIVISAALSGADEFTVQVTGNGVDKTMSGSARECLSFGKLSKGEYNALFSAKGSDGSDAVEKTFTVEESLLEAPLVTECSPEELNSLDSLRWPVTVSFFNKDYEFYTKVLSTVYNARRGRIDTEITSMAAAVEYGFVSHSSFMDMYGNLANNAFIKLTDDDNGDIRMTARLAAALPEVMSHSVIDRFLDVLSKKDSSPDEIVSAYLGLAAMDYPLLSEVKHILANKKAGSSFDDIQKLELIAALAVMGDCTSAEHYFASYLSGAVQSGDDLYISSSSDSYLATSMALVISTACNMPEAEKFASYLINNGAAYNRDHEGYQYDTASPELVYFLRNYTADARTDAIISYSVNGTQKDIVLNRFHPTTVTFSQEQFSNAGFKTTQGNIEAHFYHTGTIDEITRDNDISVSKYLYVPGGYKVGSLITVNISTGVPYCRVNDVVPSCGRYVSSERWANAQVQRVTVQCDKYGEASYTFRIMSTGEYVVESALAYSCGRSGSSDRSTINVS